MNEIPKLHGWITPEYAIHIMNELEKWLESEKVQEYFEKTDPIYIGPETEKCPSMIISAQNVT